MTESKAASFLESGRKALERADSDAIMNVFTPRARVLGTNVDQLRGVIQTAMRETQAHPLTIVYRNLSVKLNGGQAHLTFDLDVNEKSGATSAHYFTSHVSATLEQVESSQWFGLSHTHSWKISNLDADPPFSIPDT